MSESTSNRKETCTKTDLLSTASAPACIPNDQATSQTKDILNAYGGISNGPLRPLRRLRQLAEEIQSALAREDMILVGKASALLGPTLEQWAERRPEVPLGNTEMENLSRETQLALADCEEAIRLLMERNRARASDIRQHRGRNRKLRVHHNQPLKSRILRSA